MCLKDVKILHKVKETRLRATELREFLKSDGPVKLIKVIEVKVYSYFVS